MCTTEKALPNKIVQQPLNQTITVSSNYSSSRTRQCPLNGQVHKRVMTFIALLIVLSSFIWLGRLRLSLF